MTDFSISEDLLQARTPREKPRSTRITRRWRARWRRRGIDAEALTRRSWRSASRSRPGASAQAAPALRAFPAPASRAICSTSWRIAPPSTIWCGRRRRYRRIFHGTRPSDYAALREVAASARTRVRCRELEHVSGSAEPGAFVQVRLALACRPRRAGPGDRAQHRLHRHRPPARLEGADGVDRRRLQFRRPIEHDPGARSLSRFDARDLRGAARGLAGVSRAQAVRAGVLFDA